MTFIPAHPGFPWEPFRRQGSLLTGACGLLIKPALAKPAQVGKEMEGLTLPRFFLILPSLLLVIFLLILGNFFW